MISAALVALSATCVLADDQDGALTGDQFLEICQSPDMTQQGFCTGYLIGAVEGMRWGAGQPSLRAGRPVAEVQRDSDALLGFCLPSDATWGQHLDIALGYVEGHPEIRHASARLLAQLAFTEAFPCPWNRQHVK